MWGSEQHRAGAVRFSVVYWALDGGRMPPPPLASLSRRRPDRLRNNTAGIAARIDSFATVLRVAFIAK